jgi:fatty-acyl-CoA synthase
VVVVVQCRAATLDAQDRLRSAVAAVVRRVAGVDCEVVLAPTRSLTFTTSGKLSRAAVKADYLGGAIRDVFAIRDVSAMPAQRARAQLEALPVAS